MKVVLARMFLWDVFQRIQSADFECTIFIKDIEVAGLGPGFGCEWVEGGISLSMW